MPPTTGEIPAIRLLDDGNLVQLGYGAAMRRIWTAETDQTSAIAETISRDKDLTKELLSSCGVPVPEGREVDSAEDAWDAAEDIGVPVCVKPTDGNHGRGVFIDLTTREEVARAYAIAVDEGSGVLVERSIPGIEHRLLVVGGKLVAANRGDWSPVTGDGKSTVQRTDRQPGQYRPAPRHHRIASAVADPHRHRRPHGTGTPGLDADSVPAEGREVLIQRNANHAFDCHRRSPSRNRRTGRRSPPASSASTSPASTSSARTSRKPLAGQGGAIVEVNAGPSLLMHLKPGIGEPRPVGQAIVDNLFAERPVRPHADRRRHRHARQDRRRQAGGPPALPFRPGMSAWPAATASSSTAAMCRRPMPPTGRAAVACCSTVPSRRR